MKKRKTTTLIVLALEISSIAVLHAIKIKQADKALDSKAISKNLDLSQQDSRIKANYSSFAGLQ